MSDNFGCVANTIKTFSGSYFDLADPLPSMVDGRDIARGLALTCRFGGQCPRPYSVAQHSLWCLEAARRMKLPRPVQLACLLHDAAEAYVGDVVKPLKVMLPEFWPIERRVDDAVRRWARVSESAWSAEEVTTIDRAALLAERDRLWPTDGVEWAGEDDPRIAKVPRLAVRLTPWPRAEREFLHELHVFRLMEGGR